MHRSLSSQDLIATAAYAMQALSSLLRTPYAGARSLTKQAAAKGTAAARFHRQQPTANKSAKRSVKSPPYSCFQSPTCSWKDRFRSQLHAQQQRERRSPFVQHQYQQFLRKYPYIAHTGLTNHHFAPFPTPMTSTAIPAFSYLRSRLQLRNDPHASARRSSLLRARQHTHTTNELAKVRLRGRRSRSPYVRIRPPEDASVRYKMAKMHRLSYPQRSQVRPIARGHPLSTAASADFVWLDNDALVGDVRDAVKVKCANKLAHVDAGDLLVCMTRAAFDDENRQPLDEDSLIGTLGGSKKDALVAEARVQAPQNVRRDAKRQKVPDGWMKVLADERVDVLPLDREALQLYLERELREKIPIAEKDARWVSVLDTKGLCTATFNKLFFVNENRVLSPPTARIVWRALYPITSGSEAVTEETYHSFWDDLIAKVLREVSNGNFRRNTTISGLCRPNLCFYYAKQNVCVFRGEEKSSGEMQVPVQELYKNLIWRYDDAPYVFGYAAVAYQVCLVVIRKDSATSRGATAEVVNQYDLSELDGRLSFSLALLNLSTVVRPVVELIQQPFGFPEYGTIVQANGVKISFAEDCVVKEYPSDMPSDRIISNLKILHGQMKEHSVPNVVTLLVKALRDILTALVALHKLGLMHRDLRWNNVLKYQHDRRDVWFLIDFDDGACAPATQAAVHLDPESHAPEIASSSHSVKVDIWGVGYLLRTAAVRDLPPHLEAIQKQCFQPSPTKRPSAASLLKAVQKLL